MRKNEIEHLLTLFKGTPIYVEYYDYGTGDKNSEVYTDFTFSILQDHVAINDDLYAPNDILKISCTADDETRIAMMEKCDNIKDAFAIARYRLSDEIEKALDEVRMRTTTLFERQFQTIFATIKSNIAEKGTKITPESVLEHLCVNILHDTEMRQTLNKDEYNAMLNGIDNAVNKLSKEERF